MGRGSEVLRTLGLVLCGLARVRVFPYTADREIAMAEKIRIAHDPHCSINTYDPNTGIINKCTCGVDDAVAGNVPRTYAKDLDSGGHDPDCPAAADSRKVCICKISRSNADANSDVMRDGLRNWVKRNARDINVGDIVKIGSIFCTVEGMPIEGDYILLRGHDVDFKLPRALIYTCEVYLRAKP